MVNRIVDSSFIASYYKRTGVRPHEIIKRLDSENTVFVLAQENNPKTVGKVIYASSIERASAVAYRIFVENTSRKQPVLLYTDEIKAVEAFLINRPVGLLIYPPTRSGMTAKAILREARVTPDVNYRKVIRFPVNIEGANMVRKVLRKNPNIQIVFSNENRLEDDTLYYNVIPITGKRRQKRPQDLLRLAIQYERLKVKRLLNQRLASC